MSVICTNDLHAILRRTRVAMDLDSSQTKINKNQLNCQYLGVKNRNNAGSFGFMNLSVTEFKDESSSGFKIFLNYTNIFLTVMHDKLVKPKYVCNKMPNESGRCLYVIYVLDEFHKYIL